MPLYKRKKPSLQRWTLNEPSRFLFATDNSNNIKINLESRCKSSFKPEEDDNSVKKNNPHNNSFFYYLELMLDLISKCLDVTRKFILVILLIILIIAVIIILAKEGPEAIYKFKNILSNISFALPF